MKGGAFVSIRITTESASDLCEKTAAEFSVGVIAMNIIIGNRVYKDGIELDSRQMLKMQEIATTSAINPQEYEEFFSSQLPKDGEIIHISLGSRLSSTFRSASFAAKSFENVRVIDSRNLSAGTGLLCVMGSQLAQSGMESGEILRLLKKKRDLICTSFVIDDIERIRKGGRCSSVEALGANLLAIKPSIEIVDGAMKMSKKYRGRGRTVREKYIEKRIEQDDPDRTVCFLNHTLESEDEVESLKNLLYEKYGFERVFVNRAGCCTSAHSGKNCVGVIYVLDARA